MIATPEHREALLVELRSRKLDVDAIEAAGDLPCSTRARCSGLHARRHAGPALFNTHVTAAIAQRLPGTKGCTIRAYGEMVDVLWQDGHTAAAIRLGRRGRSQPARAC